MITNIRSVFRPSLAYGTPAGSSGNDTPAGSPWNREEFVTQVLFEAWFSLTPVTAPRCRHRPTRPPGRPGWQAPVPGTGRADWAGAPSWDAGGNMLEPPRGGTACPVSIRNIIGQASACGYGCRPRVGRRPCPGAAALVTAVLKPPKPEHPG